MHIIRVPEIFTDSLPVLSACRWYLIGDSRSVFIVLTTSSFLVYDVEQEVCASDIPYTDSYFQLKLLEPPPVQDPDRICNISL
jgi:hypothetical protein